MCAEVEQMSWLILRGELAHRSAAARCKGVVSSPSKNISPSKRIKNYKRHQRRKRQREKVRSEAEQRGSPGCASADGSGAFPFQSSE